MDETTISLRFPIRACWMKRGQQKRLPAPTDTRQYHHLMGAYNWRTDAVSALHVERKNGQTFIEFLEYLLLERYPNQRIVLVMDNASYHHSAPVKAALSLFEHRARVSWLPARCPDLNPIERYWRHLEDLACANKLYMSLEALAETIGVILAAQFDPTNELRFAFSKDLH